MANRQRQPGFLQRIPLESISPRLAPWGLALHAGLTLGGSAWGIREALVNGGYATAYELYQAIGINTLLAFGLSTATVVTTAEVIDSIMVIAHFVGKRMKAQGIAEGIERGRTEGIERGRAEGIERGRTEGVAEGIEQGRTEGVAEGIEQGRSEGVARKEAEVAQWYARLLDAHPELKDAIEPPPIGDAKPKAE